MADEIRDHDESAINRCLLELRKHFDTVQIFVSRQDGMSTVGGSYGYGNWFARVGQVQLWMDFPIGATEDGEDIEESDEDETE